MEKSHVSLGQHICPVCDKQHDRQSVILLDQHLHKKFDRTTVVGLALCEEHFKEGFVCLIEGEPTPDGKGFTRHGRVCHVATRVFPGVFNEEVPPGLWMVAPSSIFDQLEQIHANLKEENTDEKSEE